MKCYGDQSYCSEWQPDIKYDPLVEAIQSPQIITHIY